MTLSEKIQYLYPSAVSLVDFEVNDNGDGVASITFWKTASLGVQPSQAALDAVTQAQIDAAKLTRLHNAAKAYLSADDDRSKEIKGFVLVVLDEINILRAALGLTARTITQLKNAIAAKIDAGNADG